MKIPVKITSSAKEYLSIMTEQNKKNYVRLSVSGGGCSGFSMIGILLIQKKMVYLLMIY